MDEQQPKKRSRMKKGLATTAAITAAAGLAAAAIVYLRNRGIHPSDEVKKFGGRAKTAADILKGESKAAYEEVRDTIIGELADTDEPITKRLVMRTIDDVLKALKKHGEMTSKQFAFLGKELKADWEALLSDARQERE